ncbi:universal stress protein UspA [Trinickia dabaoshanensis]|uniref:Universal stress protein UspA n=1 Tax=Trinickia dabaoshanensis TaxID=564714 RepID=A0A2N7VJ85_9BURK|nr:universal stress protein [Trinickia dabaoshanensis]PMS17210.1 universal stress protein UspA [Trinickia dabaoshanensis]
MSYKTLLVHVDDSARSEARTAFACDLALKYGAHLIGLYVVCQEVLRPLVTGQESLDLGANEARHAQRMNDAQARFTAQAQRAGCPFEWRAPSGPSVETAVLHARHADLLVFGQEDPEDSATHIARYFVEDVIMSAGRPAIVMPHAGRVATFGESVLVAWDGGREAARALADAVPILKRARFVTVVSVSKRPEDSTAEEIDVAAYLERHGVRASFASVPRQSGMGTGATLLNQLSDRHADLLVMGAYGHARARERVLGGVTHTLFETMTVPVFMSH